jgi:transposase
MTSFVGIDVSSLSLDVWVRPADLFRSFPFQESSFDEILAFISPHSPERVVIEATGGIEVQLVSFLAVSNMPVVVVNPKDVRNFAKATRQLAKTDKIDAKVLAHFAEAIKPEIREIASEAHQELEWLVTRRKQLMNMITEERGRQWSAPRKIQEQMSNI